MRDFTTASGMQTSVTLHVFQGERPMALDNTRLGQFSLDGLPPPPRGVPKIEVTFDINADGILNVTVQDMARQRTQSIHITARLSFPPPQALTMTQRLPNIWRSVLLHLICSSRTEVAFIRESCGHSTNHPFDDEVDTTSVCVETVDNPDGRLKMSNRCLA